jgi:hypothetical protein
MRRGEAERCTHDDKRHGTISQFAALDVAAGTVIGKGDARHRSWEFLSLPRQVDRTIPKELDVPVVMDNDATHKPAEIHAWLARRPHWHVPRPPTGASWINQVDRFFADPMGRALRRGVHRSTIDLEAAIAASIEAHNADPKPFRWTKSADDILATIERFCLRTLDSAQKQIETFSDSGHWGNLPAFHGVQVSCSGTAMIGGRQG